MRNAVFLIALISAMAVSLCQGVVPDEECFAVSAKRLLGKLAYSEDVEFKDDVSKYSGSAFLTSARYCLGPDASASSQDFLACILSMSVCPRNGLEIVNLEICACDTAYCILKNCAQKWLEQLKIADFSCLKPCLKSNSTCIIQQTGSMGQSPTTLHKKTLTNMS